ncbi:MAG: hypothetical protein AB7S75_14340 [Desulfococcaceae bacterium]
MTHYRFEWTDNNAYFTDFSGTGVGLRTKDLNHYRFEWTDNNAYEVEITDYH